MSTTAKRRYPRIPLRHTVLVTRCEGDSLDQLGQSRTVGLGGCSFLSERSLGVGSVLELMISLRPGALEVQARVVYELRGAGGTTEVGVEFLGLAEAQRAALERLMGQRLAST